MEYLSKFDSSGRRIGTVVRGINYDTDEQKAEYIANGYVEISEDDWQYYVGNHGMGDNGTGYVYDSKTGKPVSAPAYVPTKDEKAAALFNECQADLKEIDAQIVNAIIIKDTELVEELRQEREERVAEYEAALEELEGGE